jgi:hypothetical protein
MEDKYYNKYLKYKTKYLNLSKQMGGSRQQQGGSRGELDGYEMEGGVALFNRTGPQFQQGE